MTRLAVTGLAMLAIGVAVMSFGVGQAVSSSPVVTQSETQTHTHTIIHTRRRTKFVTVHVRGKVIRRHDHVLVVYVPRVVFHTHTRPSRRIVVPAHIVRVFRRSRTPTSPPVTLVAGVAPPPVTVTVPVTVDVPVTVPGPASTVTLPQATTTVTLPQDTTTVTVPLTVTSSSASN